ncbi:DUF1178 family protein [Roseibium sp.]|uniref:DUF1178 family protein n=1 Tax=Roseibium sp. TaxID=1936156 RepID=UPI003A980703
MIKYSLCCESAHDFEGWFRNSDDFDRQCALRLVTCPVCGSADVRKSLMAPAVSTSRKKEASGIPAERTPAVTPDVDSAAPLAKADAGQTALVTAHPKYQELVEGLRTLRKKMIDSSDYVGKEFAEEARKIHYGEAEERNIYGETSKADIEALADEGISVLPLPVLPDDQN